MSAPTLRQGVTLCEWPGCERDAREFAWCGGGGLVGGCGEAHGWCACGWCLLEKATDGAWIPFADPECVMGGDTVHRRGGCQCTQDGATVHILRGDPESDLDPREGPLPDGVQ